MNSEEHTQKHSETESPATPTDEHATQTESPLSPAFAGFQPPPPPSGHTTAEQEPSEPKWRKNFTLAMEVIGLAVLIVYTAFAGCQWHVANETLTEIKNSSAETRQIIDAAQDQADAAGNMVDSADNFSNSAEEINSQTKVAVAEFARIARAAENSVKSTLEISRLEQRAWIVAGLSIPAFDVDKALPPASMQASNTGKTFAKRIDIIIYLQFSKDVPTVLPTNLPEVSEKSVAVMAPNLPYESRFKWPSTTLKLKEIYPQVPITNDWYVVAWGTITYDDVFHPPGRHTTKFCGYRKLSESGQTLQCAMNNDAD